jgi:hypothetical protein
MAPSSAAKPLPRQSKSNRIASPISNGNWPMRWPRLPGFAEAQPIPLMELTDMANPQFAPEFVDEDAAAKVLGFAVGTLQQWRVRGGGPPFYKFGAGKQGSVRYNLDEVRVWMMEHRRLSTSSPPGELACA